MDFHSVGGIALTVFLVIITFCVLVCCYVGLRCVFSYNAKTHPLHMPRVVCHFVDPRIGGIGHNSAGVENGSGPLRTYRETIAQSTDETGNGAQRTVIYVTPANYYSHSRTVAPPGGVDAGAVNRGMTTHDEIDLEAGYGNGDDPPPSYEEVVENLKSYKLKEAYDRRM